jgi:hypothetical protein
VWRFSFGHFAATDEALKDSFGSLSRQPFCRGDLLRYPLLRVRKEDTAQPIMDGAALIPIQASAFGRVFASVIPPALVEELGVALVVKAADDGAVADLFKPALLEDALHTLIMTQRRAAHGSKV